MIYFIGIGGIGMSALARWFVAMGYRVAGYDRTETPLTIQLEKEGMDIHYEDRVDLIPEEVRTSTERSLVIYTPAIPAEHHELNYLRDMGHRLHKRSEVLGIITQDTFTIAVAGTHGKTTTTSMVAHILKENDFNITSLIGGISANYDSNFVVNKADRPPVFVVEADEYDRSFLTLEPNIAIVTSADADHLDIYGAEDVLKQGFRDFIDKLQENGTLIINEKITDLADGKDSISARSYGLNRGQFFASNISISDGFFIFDLYAENLILRSLKLGVPGFYNVENAVAAIMVALQLDISEQGIREALASYKGVRRRFEFLIRRPDRVFVDDYVHHPEEIRAFLGSLTELYTDRHVTVIFQPHLYSRTRDFYREFADSLSSVDRVILLDIYPAREEPMEGVSSKMIFELIDNDDKFLCSKDDLLTMLGGMDTDVVATVGAGDIDQMVQPIKDLFSK